MRVLLKLVVVLGVLVAGAWIGGEVLLARQAKAMIASDPQLEAAAVRELRDATRIGVRIEDLVVEASEGGVTLPWLDMWVLPHRLNEIHVSLPDRGGLTVAGRSVPMTAGSAKLSARFSPAHAMALSEARASADDLTLDGQPVASHLSLLMRLTGYGSDAPPDTGAAYDVTADLSGLSLDVLEGVAAKGVVSAKGGGRLWLDRAPARGGAAQAPRLVGMRFDGLDIGLDDLGLRLWGRLVADAGDRLEGELLIDTADIAGFVNRAASLGMLPSAMAPLVTTMLNGLAGAGTEPGASETADTGSRDSAGAERSRIASDAFPAPRDGEARIHIRFHDGKSFLGPMPIGPAPPFPG